MSWVLKQRQIENRNTLQIITVSAIKNNPFLRIMETMTHKIVLSKVKTSKKLSFQ